MTTRMVLAAVHVARAVDLYSLTASALPTFTLNPSNDKVWRTTIILSDQQILSVSVCV